MIATLTAKQLKALEFLSFKYGNGGSMSSCDNQKFLSLLLANKPAEAYKFFHRITGDCKQALDKVLNNDFSELRENQVAILGAMFNGEKEVK